MDEEVSTFARSISNELKDIDDEELKERLPINPDNEDIFDAMSDGRLGLHLLNKADKDRIDMRTVNKGKNINIYKIRENLDQFFAGCKGLIKVIGIDAQSFLDKTPHLMLAIIWQILRLIATVKINLDACKEIMRLAKEGEELGDLRKLSAEEILKRWMNFHLNKAGQEPIDNLGKDLADSKKCMYVLNQLDGGNCPLDGLAEGDDVKRAQICIDNSKKMGCSDVVGAKDIVKGNSKVNILFVAEMFNTKHGLEEVTQEEFEAAGLIDDDIEGSKEERAFRLWINTLELKDLDGNDIFINNLYDDLCDGIVLCKAIHKIDQTVVEWNRIEKKPDSVFKKNINC